MVLMQLSAVAFFIDVCQSNGFVHILPDLSVIGCHVKAESLSPYHQQGAKPKEKPSSSKERGIHQSKPRQSIHLFNCDRKYKLDAVEDWLMVTKPRLGFEISVQQHYFPLAKMTEMSNETIPGLQMDMAVLVVHAHESCLSINEERTGIGYAKIYRALLQKTGEKRSSSRI